MINPKLKSIYQFALIVSLENLWVVDSIGHLGANRLADLLQQCVGATIEFTFGSKALGGSFRKRQYHKPWFDNDYCITKQKLRLLLKANPNSHVVNH
jgi:hypothetical protein